MTRYQLGEIVATLLGYNSTNRPADNRDVFFVADQIRGALIGEYINGSARSKAAGHTVLGQFCKPMLFPIKLDAIRNRKYIDLGTQVLGLPDNAGLVQIGLPQEEETSFVVTQMGMTAVTSSMEVGIALNRFKCWIEGTRIHFFYLDNAFTDILVKGVPSLFAKNPDGSDLIGEDDELPQPYEFGRFLIENAMSAFAVQKATIQDKNDDGTITPQN